MRLGSSLKRRRGESWSFDASSPRLRRIAALIGASLGGLLLGYLGATQVLFPAAAPPGETTEVPDIRGLSLDEAMDRLSDAGIDLGEIAELQHPRVDSGLVVGQSPLPGQRVRPDGAARLTLSLGPESREVPPVLGLRADRALAVLQATGLEVLADSVEADEPRGRIVVIEPDEGTSITLPGEVRVTVSLGPPTVEVPGLLGLAEAEARDSLAALGLEVIEVEEVFRFGRDQGRVVRQEPPAGEEVERGAGVRLVVGRRGG
jgi:serine/threonine-protein kinase